MAESQDRRPTAWKMPGGITVFHQLGRNTYPELDYYELDDSGNLAVVGEDGLLALFAAGSWNHLEPAEAQND